MTLTELAGQGWGRLIGDEIVPHDSADSGNIFIWEEVLATLATPEPYSYKFHYPLFDPRRAESQIGDDSF